MFIKRKSELIIKKTFRKVAVTNGKCVLERKYTEY